VAKPGNSALVRGLEESPEQLFDTPLIQAARRGDLKSVEVLLEAGAKINASNDVGHTALIVAVKERHYEVAEVLLAHGADIDIRDKAGNLALAYDSYDSPLYERLGGTVYSVDIFTLAREGSPETLATVLDNTDFDLNTSDAYGQTLLYYAALNPDAGAVDVLVNHGVNINHHDTSGWTVLMHAIRDNPNPDMISLLLARGASPTDHAGIQTPLLVAATAGRLEVIQMLLDAGVDPLPELPYVARYGSYEALEFILNNLPTKAPAEKQQALDEALLQTIYRQTFPENPNSTKEAARKVALLLNAGVQPDDKRIFPDSTMLFVTIAQGDLETIKVLIAGGADINRVRESEFYLGTNQGVARVHCTPLAFALSYKQVEAAKYLADVGASLESTRENLESECASAFFDEARKREIEQRLLELTSQ
jgi:ankyrin repeat protein